LTAGRERKSGKDHIHHKSIYHYQESLSLVGVEFPLFTSVELREQESLINSVSTEIKREIFLPSAIRNILLLSMQKVAKKNASEGMSSLNRLYHKHPEALKSYIEMKNDIIGKTSTSEALENLNLDLTHGTCMCKHVWFGGISFNSNSQTSGKAFISNDIYEEPELVIVIHLRFGSFGKEAAPLAAQIVKKWRDIKNKHEKKSISQNH
jgi:cell division protein FtsI/penicillin-binding protein 2